MKRNLLTACLVSVALGAASFTALMSASAQSSATQGVRIGVVNINKVFQGYVAQADIAAEIEKIQGQLQAENDKRRAQIEQLQNTLTNMSPDDATFQTKQDELLRMQIDYRSWREVMQDRMTRELATQTAKTYDEAIAAVNELAKLHGFDIVLSTSDFPRGFGGEEAITNEIRTRHVIYNSASVDLTQAVVERLNAQYEAAPQKKHVTFDPTLGS